MSALPLTRRLAVCGCVLLSSLVLLVVPEVGLAEKSETVEVAVRGLEDEMLQNVLAALAIPPGMVRDGQIDRRSLERFRQRASDRVREALQPFGYYHAEVDAGLEPAPGGWRLAVDVRPGAPVRLRSVHVAVEGEGRTALEELVQMFPLREGDVLRHQLYEEGKQALESRALDLGYLDAAFTSREVRVHLGENSAEIDLVLATGPRFRFGTAKIEGAPEYPDKFLRRYLAFAPGEDFSFTKLGQTQLNFLNSDRFREAVITPRREAAENLQVPVDVQLVTSPPKRLRPGIGYATDTGGRFSLSYRDLNVRHLGHELQAEIVAAQLKQSLGVGYIIPSARNVDSQTALRLAYDEENLDAYDRRALSAEIERVRAFGRGRLGSVYLRLLREDFTVGAEEEDTSRLVLPGVRFSRRRYVDPVRPKEGYQFNLEGRGTHQVMGSDTGLLQVLAAGNFLLPLPGRFTLFTRVNSGVTLQNEPLREIPPSLRFFAGGDRSVRGYAYQSIGPRDDAGEVVGGKNLLVGSVELVRDFRKNLGVAIFYDVGDAFNSFTNINWRQGAGIGLRWYTPVGPVNIDVARQLREENPSFRLHVSIGFGW